jgi:hypothetical protein
MAEVEQLVKMANQIADNFSFHDDAVDRLNDHLQRFWAPSMIKKLIAFQQINSLEQVMFFAKEAPSLHPPCSGSAQNLHRLNV